ncbi:MAG: PEGA domain-containing protein [Nannocystaceae bacterium]|nr:PEGA domain-containing protein [Myxococcales bacterium]
MKSKVAAKADPLIGRTVGVHYALEECIAEGPTGRLYRASHRTMHRTVVVNLLGHAAFPSEEAVLAFEDGARSLIGLEHPNITVAHDSGVDGEFGPYLVTELVEGETLEAFLEDVGPLPIHTFVPIASQILKALGAAHARGLIHGDLKAEDVFLIEHQGRANFVKICDLGLRVLISGADPETSDPRVDVHSIGALFYRMLTGRVPRPGDPISLGQALPAGHEVPALLVELVDRSLARDPERRPIDTNEVVEHLIDAVPAALFRLPRAGEGRPGSSGGVPEVSAPHPVKQALSGPRVAPPPTPPPAPEITPLRPPEPAPEPEVLAPVEAVSESIADEEKSGSGGLILGLLVLVAGGVAFFLYTQGQLPFVNAGTPEPKPVVDRPTPTDGPQVEGEAGETAVVSELATLLTDAGRAEAQGAHDEAVRLYREALALDPSNRPAQERLTALLAEGEEAAGSSGWDTVSDEEETTAAETTGEAPASETTGEEPPPVDGETVDLEVITDPKGATVTVDGKKAGETPIVLNLAPGNRKIEIRLNGYKRIRKTVKAVVGEELSVMNLALAKSQPRTIRSGENIDIDPEEGIVTKIPSR